MNIINDKQFKLLFCNYEHAVIFEHTIATLLNIDFNKVHNNIIIDDQDIINNKNINYLKYRPYAIFISYEEYIFIFLINKYKKDLENPKNIMLGNLVADEYPKKSIKLVEINLF